MKKIDMVEMRQHLLLDSAYVTIMEQRNGDMFNTTKILPVDLGTGNTDGYIVRFESISSGKPEDQFAPLSEVMEYLFDCEVELGKHSNYTVLFINKEQTRKRKRRQAMHIARFAA